MNATASLRRQRLTLAAMGAAASEPSLVWEPARLPRLHRLVGFARASTATDPVSLTALTSGTPRLVAGRGLLIEGARTNLLLASADLNTSWTKNRATVSTNQLAAPDGTLTADNLIEDSTAANTHGVSQALSATAGQAYTLTVWARKLQRHLVLALESGAGLNHYAAFDLDAGTVAGTFGAPTTSLAPWPNGWYRCRITATASLTGGAAASLYAASVATVGGRIYTGNGASGLSLWGAQLEAGLYPTSYIATTTAQVTRAAETASITALAPWFNPQAGTLLTEVELADPAAADTDTVLATFYNPSRIETRIDVAGRGGAFISGTGGNTGTNLYGGPTLGPQALARVVVAYGGVPVAAVNGAFAGSTAVNPGTLGAAALHLGHLGALGHFGFGGWVRRVAYWPFRLSPADLLQRTAR